MNVVSSIFMEWGTFIQNVIPACLLRQHMKFLAPFIKLLVWLSVMSASWSPAAPLRRPLSPQTPMFLFQVQQPDASDPQACINAVPADVRPYTVMMYCMGAQSGNQTNGFAFADYFCNVAQQNGMWCMFQCASGYANSMANTNTADYERLIQKYPNLIGIAFAEQNWGFGSVTTSSAFGPSTFSDRVELFAQLLPIFNQYGCFLYSSEMQSYGGNSGYNMIHKLRDFPDFRNATLAYTTNFIVGDKTTQGSAFYDNESCTLGTFLTGHAGFYASRCDETAWGSCGYSQLYGLKNPAVTNGDTGFTMPEAVHGMFIAEHFLLQGATVIDGPEFPRYSTIYNGQLMPCYKNTTCDVFRKVLDGTIKIPSVSEVRSNTPLVYVTDSPNWWDAARTPADFYDGLYLMAGNQSWLKSSGRYSSIPETFTNGAYEMSFFKTNVLQTQYTNRWPTVAAKTNEFNSYFPAEYTITNGPFFAARRDNRWLTYNPYINSNLTTSASLSLKYNTCTNLYLQYPPQTFAVITESNQSLQIYFNNYFTDKDFLWTNNNVSYSMANWIANPTDSTTNTTRTTLFQISGCTNMPTYTLTDRGSHKPMTNSAILVNGVFTLTLTGNGPCDITINCSGSAVRTGFVSPPNVMVPPPNYVPAVPVPPSFVSATPGYTQATLNWKATNCLYYNLKRGTSVNGPFTNIATGITNSVNLYSSFIGGTTVYNKTYGYVDAAATVSNTYYYVVSGVNVSGEGPNSAPAVVAIMPTYTNLSVADAYVESGSATSNYGSSTNMLVKNNVTLAARSAYLMFNVSALTNVRSATVTLVPNRVDDPTVKMYYEVASTNWTENGITWNNQPGGTGIFLFTNTLVAGVPFTFDVTSAAANAATNGGLLSLRITQPTNSLNGLIQLCSKEHPTVSWHPVLQYMPSIGSPPVSLTANPISVSQINLAWPASSGASYYNVRRAPTSGGPYNLIAQGILATSFNDTALDSQSTYYYVVSAVYSGGESADSPVAKATTPQLPAPFPLTATLNGNRVTLNWPTVTGADSYTVRRAFLSGGPYTTMASGVAGTNYADTVYYTGANYYYIVAGVDTGGEGTNSAEAVIATPANLAIEPTDDAYVEDGSSTNINFGTSANLKVKNQGANTTFTRITYLKFDVHALTNASAMQLKLTPYQVDGSGITNAFELVTNDAWSEGSLYWTNQPGGSGIIITNLRSSNFTVNTQTTVDVTSWALSQSTNDGYFSLRISDPYTNATLVGFYSKEAATASYHPVLQFVNAGNTPPILAAISDRTIGAGVALNITNSATDSDLPAQALAFNLQSAPTNAVINSSSGVLTWRPLVTQANTTNLFIVRVVDSGTPTKFATTNFLVTVAPLTKPVISAPSLLDNNLVLQANGDSGPDYQIQTSTNLVNWSVVLTTNSPAMPFMWMTSTTNGAMSFYRILAGPPF
jgi:fibronectin type 3 domain-containing protein